MFLSSRLILFITLSLLILSSIQIHAQEEVDGNLSYVRGTDVRRDASNTYQYVEPYFMLSGDAFILDIINVLSESGKGSIIESLNAYSYILENQENPEEGQGLYSAALSTILSTPGREILVMYGHASPQAYGVYIENLYASDLGRYVPENWVQQVDGVIIYSYAVGQVLRQRAHEDLPGLIIFWGCNNSVLQGEYNWRWAFRFLPSHPDHPSYWYGRGYVGMLSYAYFGQSAQQYMVYLVDELLTPSNNGLIDSAINAYYRIGEVQREHLSVVVETIYGSEPYTLRLGDLDPLDEIVLVAGDPYLHIDPPFTEQGIMDRIVNETYAFLKEKFAGIYEYVVKNKIYPIIESSRELHGLNELHINFIDQHIDVEVSYLINQHSYSLKSLRVSVQDGEDPTLREVLSHYYNTNTFTDMINELVDESIGRISERIGVALTYKVSEKENIYQGKYISYDVLLENRPLYIAMLNDTIYGPAKLEIAAFYGFSFNKEPKLSFSLYSDLSLLELIDEIVFIDSQNYGLENALNTMYTKLLELGVKASINKVSENMRLGYYVIIDRSGDKALIRPGYSSTMLFYDKCTCEALRISMIYFTDNGQLVYKNEKLHAACIPECSVSSRTNIDVSMEEVYSGNNTVVISNSSTRSNTVVGENNSLSKDSGSHSMEIYTVQLTFIAITLISVAAIMLYRRIT